MDVHLGGDGGISPLWVAVIGVAGVVISGLISWVVSQRSIYINAVTVERTKWIGELRGNIAALSALCRITWTAALDGEFELPTPKATEAQRNEIDRLTSLITLQLNPNGAVDKNIIELLNVIPLLLDRRIHSLRMADDLLIAHAQWLLKDEWNRVKEESSLWRWAHESARKKRVIKYASFVAEWDVGDFTSRTFPTVDPRDMIPPND